MQEIIEYIIKNIVKFPDDVVITESENILDNGKKSITFEVDVNTEDLGLVIGKEGKTIKSISNILKVKAIRDGVYVDLKVKKPLTE